jgi:SAM-dependent methyltransferase
VELGLLGTIVILPAFAGREPGTVATVWSPYQKLVVHRSEHGADDGYWITVNNVGYQALHNLSDEHVTRNPERFPPEQRGYGQYDVPLRLHAAPRSVLIVGAGAGNDAAGALRRGAERITAVEIDPAIVRLGQSLHPERPYQHPAVKVVVDDARSFFARTRERYDLIVFGLLDAHTTHAMTNVRLDHYVYTRESIERARELLAPGGLVVLTFAVQTQFIADRMGRLLLEEFSGPPLVLRVPASVYGWGGVMFVNGDAAARRGVSEQLRRDPRLASLIEEWQRRVPYELNYQTPVTTDDWPYLYLPRPSIPRLYGLLGALMVLLFFVGSRLSGLPPLHRHWGRLHWHFFFLGAAFLLLEVQNISKACVALGNTWWVNAVIISGVLVMVLAANLTTSRFPRLPLAAVFALLLAACSGLYFLDLSWFAGLPYGVKAALVGGVTTIPLFFSGIVFVRSFAETPHRDEALGANLVGALCGALLQSLTFLTGVSLLLVIVAGLYGLAWLTLPRGRASPASPRCNDREALQERNTELGAASAERERKQCNIAVD